jgi:hypothetical protein
MFQNWSNMMYEMNKKKVIDKNPQKEDSRDRGGALKNRTKKDLSKMINKIYKK